MRNIGHNDSNITRTYQNGTKSYTINQLILNNANDKRLQTQKMSSIVRDSSSKVIPTRTFEFIAIKAKSPK